MADPARKTESRLSADQRSDRARGRRRIAAVWSLAVVAAGLAVAGIPPERPLLVWNASPSTPRGLYRVAALKEPRVGDLVIAWAPDAARRLAAARGYVPLRVPLVKRVAAVPRDRVCARGPRITIGGRIAARRLARDSAGRPLPWWSGCVRLGRSGLFLLSDDAAGFDGRYFGVSRRSDVVGSARLLWTSREPGHRHA